MNLKKSDGSLFFKLGYAVMSGTKFYLTVACCVNIQFLNFGPVRSHYREEFVHRGVREPAGLFRYYYVEVKNC